MGNVGNDVCPRLLVGKMLSKHVGTHVNSFAMSNVNLATSNNLMQKRHVDTMGTGHMRHIGVSARLDDTTGRHVVFHQRDGHLALGKRLPQLQGWQRLLAHSVVCGDDLRLGGGVRDARLSL
jgi:hypothetical protein